MKPCYVFDIDGTLADCSHRLHFIQSEPKDWKSFYAAVGDDKRIDHMVRLLTALDAEGERIVFVSGRSDECRDGTLHWLLENVLYDKISLYMRKAGDHRDDAIVKMELIEQLRSDGYEPIMVFEDRTRVVKAFRAAGIPVAQVADGDF